MLERQLLKCCHLGRIAFSFPVSCGDAIYKNNAPQKEMKLCRPDLTVDPQTTLLF